MARRNSEFEDVLQKLSLHIAKLDNYNLKGNAIKFISEEMLIKACGEGAFAANMPSDNNSIYLSPECIRNAIQQQKRKNEYDPRAFAVMIIDTISHEIKHNRQTQYNINAKNGNYEFGFQEWLNAMYDTVRITKKSRKLDCLENSNEAEAYDAGISGAKKFLQFIHREDDMEMDRPILKRNLPFQKFAASYGKLEVDGLLASIKEKAIMLKDEYSKLYEQGTEAIRDKNFNPTGTNQMNNVQKNTADIHGKYYASQRYFQQVIDKLNRVNAFPNAPNGNYER